LRSQKAWTFICDLPTRITLLSDDAKEHLEKRLEAAFDDLDDDAVTDEDVIVRFFDEVWPPLTDNSRRLWAFEKPTI
jgi:hypothetical protein